MGRPRSQMTANDNQPVIAAHRYRLAANSLSSVPRHEPQSYMLRDRPASESAPSISPAAPPFANDAFEYNYDDTVVSPIDFRHGGGSGGGYGGGPGGEGPGDSPVSFSKRRKPRRAPPRGPAHTAKLALFFLHFLALTLGAGGMVTGYDPYFVAAAFGASSIAGLISLLVVRQANMVIRNTLSASTAIATLFWGLIALPMTGSFHHGLGPVYATLVFCLIGALGRTLLMVLIGFSMLVMWALATNAAGLPASTSIYALLLGIGVVGTAALTIRSTLVSISVILFAALAVSAILWSYGFETYAIATLIAFALTAVYHGFSLKPSAYGEHMRPLTGLLLLISLLAVQLLIEPGVMLELGWAVRAHDPIVFQGLVVVQVMALIFMLYRWRLGTLSFAALLACQIAMGLAFIGIMFPDQIDVQPLIDQTFGCGTQISTSSLSIAFAAAMGFGVATSLFARAWRADAPLMTGAVALLFIAQGILVGRVLSPTPDALMLAIGLSILSLMTALIFTHNESKVRDDHYDDPRWTTDPLATGGQTYILSPASPYRPA